MLRIKNHREVFQSNEFIGRERHTRQPIGKQEPQQDTAQCTQETNDQGLREKNLYNVAAGESLRFENGNVLHLVRNRHVHDIVDAEAGNNKEGNADYEGEYIPYCIACSN